MAGLAYLDVVELEGGIWMGALMAVNQLGIPTEFIYSEPLAPSQLQASMYGDALRDYVSLDVIGRSLIEDSQSAGCPVVVAGIELLQLATRVKRPLCRLASTSLKPLDELKALREKQDGEVLVQLDEDGPPWSLRIYDRVNFPIEQHLNSFIDCAARFDLLEPLKRVRATLELLAKGGGQED